MRLNFFGSGDSGRYRTASENQTDLETLVLADNELQEVSEQVGRLKKRDCACSISGTTVWSEGALTALGACIGLLSDLLYLSRQSVRLTSLDLRPSLTRLQFMNISECAFAELPNVVCQFGEPDRAAGDRRPAATALPDCIGRLFVEYQSFSLRNNRLTSLPRSIGTLGDTAPCSTNKAIPLTSLPEAVATLQRLGKLNIQSVTSTLAAPA